MELYSSPKNAWGRHLWPWQRLTVVSMFWKHCVVPEHLLISRAVGEWHLSCMLNTGAARLSDYQLLKYYAGQELMLTCKVEMEGQPCIWLKTWVCAWFYHIMAIPVLRRYSVKQRLSLRLRPNDGTFCQVLYDAPLPWVFGAWVEDLLFFSLLSRDHHAWLVRSSRNVRDSSRLCWCMIREEFETRCKNISEGSR